MEAVVSQLLSPECYQTLFVAKELTGECVSLAISKMLSYLILAGSLFLRVPQILSIFQAQSAKGISAQFYYIDTLNIMIAAAAGFRHVMDFSTYGECYFLLVGNLIILAQIFLFEKRAAQLAAVFAAFGVLGFLLFSNVLPIELLDFLQISVPIPAMIASRAPQIYALWKDKSPGSLSFVMFLVNTGGSLARVFTTLREVSSMVILAGFLVSSVCNGTITLQLFYYTYIAKPKTKGA